MTDDNIETVDLGSYPGEVAADQFAWLQECASVRRQQWAEHAALPTMTLTHRTCSSCEHWSGRYKQSQQLIDGVVAAECRKLRVQNKSLGMSHKVTKGGESCSQWEAKQ